jgi:hypothetical protein
LRSRRTIKVMQKCLPRKIGKNHRDQPIEAPLPVDRVRPQKLFAVTGIDFAETLYIKVGSKMRQAYIALFIRAATRPVTLELSTDMTTDKFLLAFQRFVGRRVLPHPVYTDNARTFMPSINTWHNYGPLCSNPKLTNSSLITWKFNAQRAVWWREWWEMMVGTTKLCLRKVVG